MQRQVHLFKTSSHFGIGLLVAAILASWLVAAAVRGAPVVNHPNLQVLPFSGTAAGQVALNSPKFSIIDAPNGTYGGMMYVSEMGKNAQNVGWRVVKILPSGVSVLFTAPQYTSGASGLDIDAATADLPWATAGFYGGGAAGNMMSAQVGGSPIGAIWRVATSGAYVAFTSPGTTPGTAQLQFDRTPGFAYGGLLYISDYGGDATDGVYRVTVAGAKQAFANLANRDPRYFAFDNRAGVSPYGNNRLWVSSFVNGSIFSVTNAGVANPPLAILGNGQEGIAFGHGDAWFGSWLYSGNLSGLSAGTISIVKPGGAVSVFASGFIGAGYLQFVSSGPYAMNGKPTLYVDDGNASIYAITPKPMDFGDAPDPPYPTLLASDGARHDLPSQIYLGNLIDPEFDGQQSANADGDDVNALPDEDGVIFNTPLIPGQPATVTVTAQTSGLLGVFVNAWIDFDANGSWINDPAEYIIQSAIVNNGPNIFTFFVPPTAVVGSTFARFRIDTGNPICTTPTGYVPYGEVEDYTVNIQTFEPFEACCVPTTGKCYMETSALCLAAGNHPKGPGSACLGDTDNDGIDDICEPMTLKFIQHPDTNRTGIDIKTTQPNLLADDFLCTRRSLITNISVWGSWKDDLLPFNDPSQVSITLSIHADGGGIPGVTLWQKTFAPASFTVTELTAPSGFQWDEAWWDPAGNVYIDPGDHRIWRYDFTIPSAEAFCQVGSEADVRIYWLDVQAQPIDPTTEFGWKTTTSPDANFGSAAVWGLGLEPYNGPWNSLSYPSGVWQGQPLGLAFSLSGDEPCTPAPDLDWGDAPDSLLAPGYPTLAANGGASHLIVQGLMLGNAIDAEADGQPTTHADGDDVNPPPGTDDEDGVRFNTALFSNVPNIVTVTTTVPLMANAQLNAWIDFNGNQVWTDAGDQIITNLLMPGGLTTSNLSFTPGAITATGQTYARFRLSTQLGLQPGGAALDGEVEDYLIPIVPTKWIQRPDLTPAGVDVEQVWVEEADDFLCTMSGPITDIHVWGSFLGDEVPAGGLNQMRVTLKLYRDVPAGPHNPYSHPGEILWHRTFEPGTYNAGLIAKVMPGEWWHDPAHQTWIQNGDTQVYQLDFIIPTGEAYRQREGTIYWLGVRYDRQSTPASFGWKTSQEHWNDDACWLDDSLPIPTWKELRYGDGHPMAGDSMDLAFAITGTHEQPQDLEYGDAPEGVLAYPASGVQGAFPTCATVGPSSWIQHTNFGAWLGPAFDLEPDGNAGDCAFAAYDKDECFQDGDAGLMRPPAYTIQGGVVVPCVPAQTGPLGATCQTAVWGKDIDIRVHNTMPNQTVGYLNVLMDWDQNGAWGGASQCQGSAAPALEYVLVDFLIPYGYDGPVSALMAANTGFLIGPNAGHVWARFSITERPLANPAWDGSGFFEDGETEDYLLLVADALDYGDAPDPGYPTLLASNGARHGKGAPILGAIKDLEADGLQSANADGDDLNNQPDEDGVLFNINPLVPGTLAQITVTLGGVAPGGTANLNAWIDFGADGSWAEAGDMIFDNLVIIPGPNVLNFVVPAGAKPNTSTFARFRVHTGSAVGRTVYGWIPYGEVEDYRIQIGEEQALYDLGDAPDSSNTTGFAMTTYVPPVAANFPTVYNAGSPPYGPLHRQPLAKAYLGNVVSLENEADTGWDNDPTNNILPSTNNSDLDGVDDGALGLPLYLPNCLATSFQYKVKFAVAVPPTQPMYVNVWFDWNRDGDWDDTLQCPQGGAASEWAVQNQAVSSVAPGTLTFTTPPFLPWHVLQTGGVPKLWMRITLSERAWQPFGLTGYAGSGPQGGYEYGETEDYYFTPLLCVRTIVKRAIYYNNSIYDGNTAGFVSAAQENGAIAPDRVPLLPGAAGALANLSNFHRGVNGLILDLSSGPGCSPLNGVMSGPDIAATFSFMAGNGSTMADFSSVIIIPVSVNMVTGGGSGGSDRVYIILPDQPSTNPPLNSKWLRMTLKSTPNGGKLDLASDDVEYMGWAKGEAGSVGMGFALVNSTDVNAIKVNPHTSLNPTVITDATDNTKDALVNTTDVNNALTNQTTSLNGLKLITAP